MVKYTDFNIIYKQQRILIENSYDVYRKIFLEVKRIADNLEYNKIELAESLLSLREQGGRLFQELAEALEMLVMQLMILENYAI